MPKIVILEGNATSGKSVLQEKLTVYLQAKKKKVLQVDEKVITKSLIKPDTRNAAGSIAHLKEVIKNYFYQDYEYIVFDRFHFTHIVTLGANFKEFKELDTILSKSEVYLIYLYFEPKVIVDRIRYSLEHRTLLDPGYVKHLKRKIGDAKTVEEENKKIHDYYLYRLLKYDKIIDKSKLKILKLDVSHLRTKEGFNRLIPLIETFIKI